VKSVKRKLYPKVKLFGIIVRVGEEYTLRLFLNGKNYAKTPLHLFDIMVI